MGDWTPSFTAQIDCDCGPSDEDCHTLYVGKIVATSGNQATLAFKKTGGGGPSVDVSYWVVVADGSPDCNDVGVYTVRKEGTWLANEQLDVSVNIWPDESSCEDAAEGDYKRLFIVSGGAGQTNEKVWFQKEPLIFQRICD